MKIKTASRITFALPSSAVSPVPIHAFDPIHPPSPQMPATSVATSIEIQTDETCRAPLHEQQCQTEPVDVQHRSIQTEEKTHLLISTAAQCESNLLAEQHIVCRDLTACACVEQLVKTRQFLLETNTKVQVPAVSLTLVAFSRSILVCDLDRSNSESFPTDDDRGRIHAEHDGLGKVKFESGTTGTLTARTHVAGQCR